jgi:dCMP deaminase
VDRPSWDEYGLGIAKAISVRGDCRRRKVGAVILDANGHRLVGGGYNGTRPGQPGCLDGACPRGLLTNDQIAPNSSYDTGPGKCIAAHAEANTLLDCDPLRRIGATLYISEVPCDGCKKIIAVSGIARVVAPEYEWVVNGTQAQ